MPDEPLITCRDVAELLGNVGRGGGRLNPATVTRWMRNGVRQADGAYKRLKAVRLGGRLMTTRNWVEDFLASPIPSTTA